MKACPFLNSNKKLALIAIILGIIAIFGGNPNNDKKVSFNSKNLALMIDKKVDRISVIELAEKIIENKADFRLIDLREKSDFDKYHIPLAECYRVTNFNSIDLPRNLQYFIISNSDVISGQAWTLLKARGYKAVSIVCGGTNAWKNKILFPSLASNASEDEIAQFERIKEISKYFGGKPQTGVSVTASDNLTMDMPKLKMPTQVKVKRKKKLQKEGC